MGRYTFTEGWVEGTGQGGGSRGGKVSGDTCKAKAFQERLGLWFVASTRYCMLLLPLAMRVCRLPLEGTFRVLLLTHLLVQPG